MVVLLAGVGIVVFALWVFVGRDGSADVEESSDSLEHVHLRRMAEAGISSLAPGAIRLAEKERTGGATQSGGPRGSSGAASPPLRRRRGGTLPRPWTSYGSYPGCWRKRFVRRSGARRGGRCTTKGGRTVMRGGRLSLEERVRRLEADVEDHGRELERLRPGPDVPPEGEVVDRIVRDLGVVGPAGAQAVPDARGPALRRGDARGLREAARIGPPVAGGGGWSCRLSWRTCGGGSGG